MSRQQCGPKKVRKLAEQTGLDIAKVLVRGGTEHRRDLWLKNGWVVYLWADGSISDAGVRWRLMAEGDSIRGT